MQRVNDPAATVNNDDGDRLLSTVSEFQPGDSTEDVYDRWATTYDGDLVDRFGYNSPALVASTVAALVDDLASPIVDFACGTGLSGAALAAVGFGAIDGIDVSAQMLAVAHGKGVYRNLIRADLTSGVRELPDATFAAATIVGSIAPGHLEPEHLPALIDSVEPRGPIVVYFNASSDMTHDYRGRMQRLEADGHWIVEHRERTNYMDALDRPGWLIAARRPG